MQISFCGLEDLSFPELREVLAAGPFIVRVDFQVVTLEDDEAGRVEGLRPVLDADIGLGALSVFAAAGQEAAHDELVHALFFLVEGGWVDEVDGVDGRMCFVVVAAVARL